MSNVMTPYDSDPAAPGNAGEANFWGALVSLFNNNDKKEVEKEEASTAAKTNVDAYWDKQQKESDAKFTGKPSSSSTNYRDAAELALDGITDEYNRVYGGKGGINEQVSSAYGAAAARGAEGVKNIYNEGQRGASYIDNLYGGSAARAQGAAASSGTSPVSGDAVYAPTTNRAYGSTIADYTGSASTISARDLSNSNASRSGSGKISIDDWARTSMLEMKTALNMEYDFAVRQAKSAKEQETLDFAKRKASDTIDALYTSGRLEFIKNLWKMNTDNDPGAKIMQDRIKELYNDNEKAFNAALKKHIEAGSIRGIEYWISSPSQVDEMGNFIPSN